jgi:hypothetical protein
LIVVNAAVLPLNEALLVPDASVVMVLQVAPEHNPIVMVSAPAVDTQSRELANTPANAASLVMFHPQLPTDPSLRDG